MGKKYWLLFTLISTIVLVIFLFSFEEKEEEIVAYVDGEKITQSQLVEELKRRYGKEVLNDYINKLVILKAAEKYEINVDRKEIEREYNKLQEEYDSEEGNTASGREQMGFNKDELMQNIKLQLLWEELATKDVVIPEKDLKTYYQEYQEQFKEPEKVHLKQIVVKNKQEGLQVVKELKNGSDFNTLAQEMSMDILTASKGGDLGFISLEDTALPPQIINTVKVLKIGEVSDPIKIKDGYAIIQIVERKKAINYSFDDVKGEIRRKLALNQVSPLPEVLEQLKKEMNVKIIDPSLQSLTGDKF
ncbi:peptidyl-prolyl cis-trans isomerase [Tepidibacillus sp. LV47]|uniref:peptidyl-prolyl cis-trans isomerase n=1 Tax=Tepidibacillus sp. LV47 TaxID=3398228 RepID=UPI003AB0F57C